MSFLVEFYEFVKERKKFVLIPIFIVVLLLGVLLAIGGSGSVMAPFIYTLF